MFRCFGVGSVISSRFSDSLFSRSSLYSTCSSSECNSAPNIGSLAVGLVQLACGPRQSSSSRSCSLIWIAASSLSCEHWLSGCWFGSGGLWTSSKLFFPELFPDVDRCLIIELCTLALWLLVWFRWPVDLVKALLPGAIPRCGSLPHQ